MLRLTDSSLETLIEVLESPTRWNQSAGSEPKEIICYFCYLSQQTWQSNYGKGIHPQLKRQLSGQTTTILLTWEKSYLKASHSLSQGQKQRGLPRCHSDGARWLILLQRDLVPEGPYTCSKTSTKGELQCFSCRDWGHVAAFCPRTKSSGVKAVSKPGHFL